MSRIAILGDGGWGTALALHAQRAGHAVRVWGPFPAYLETVRARRENTKFLPGIPLPEAIAWTADRAEAVDGADLAVLAVPSRFYRDVAASFAPVLPASARVMSVTKGLDATTGRRMTEVAEEVLGRAPVAALSGPSFAEEVARGLPAAVVIACRDAACATALQGLWNYGALRVYTSEDVAGVELGGALKNVIALAAGISDGLGFGGNARAALITRGLAEMARLGIALGAQAATFAGLSGMGDLVLTCTGTLSRNHAVGERLGRGESLETILGGMEQVAEGVVNCGHALALARAAGVEMPIMAEVHAVLYEGKSPREAVRRLLERDPRPERG